MSTMLQVWLSSCFDWVDTLSLQIVTKRIVLLVRRLCVGCAGFHMEVGRDHHMRAAVYAQLP
jgi:hypothetical protein